MRGDRKWLGAAFLVFFVSSPLFPRQTLVLNDPDTSYTIDSVFNYLEDPSGEMTIEDILRTDSAGLFTLNTEGKTGFGYTDSAYWLRFTVQNVVPDTVRWLIQVDYSWFDSVRLYSPTGDGGYSMRETGYTMPVESRDVKARKFLFNLIIPTGETRTYYLRFQTTDLMRLNLTVFSYRYFLRQDHESQISYGFFFGMLFIIALYNLVLFIFLKDRSYLYFALFLLFGMIHEAQENGLFYEYLSAAPGWMKFERYFIYFAAMVLFGTLFTMRFLDTRKTMPVIHKTAVGIVFLCICQMVLNIFHTNNFLEPFSIVLTYSAIIMSIYAGVLQLIRRNRAALFFTIAWLPLVIGSFLALYRSDYLGSMETEGFFLSRANQIGLSLSALLFSVALADRYRILRKEKELTEELNVRQTDFFINLAHETKTPLTLIKNYLDEYMTVHETTRELTIIKGNIDKLLQDMVNFFDMLNFARGKGLYRNEGIVDFSAYLEDKRDLFITTAERKGMTIRSQIEPGLRVSADPLALERIVNNLLDNTLKYNDPGGEVSIELRGTGRQLRFSVSDDGPGIRADRLDDIFLPYYQLSGRKRNFQGIGLGLAVARGAVHDLGGNVRVANKRDKGCTFTVTLPRYQPAKGEAPSAARTDAAGVSVPSLPVSVSGRSRGAAEAVRHEGSERSMPGAEEPRHKARPKVLVVEDNADLLDLLKRKLGLSFEVDAAAGGEAAFRILEESPPADVIVSDIMMDGMDGYELFDRLRGDPRYAEIPVLFITARTDTDERDAGLEKGAVDFIHKPFSVGELTSKIEAILRYGEIKRQAYEKEKFSTLGVVLAGISHEIFNPLSGITAPLAALKKILSSAGLPSETDARVRKHFGYIEGNIDRIENAVHIMRTLSTEKELDRNPLDVGSVVLSAAEALGLKGDGNIRLDIRLDPEAEIRGDADALYQIIRNLLANAVDAMDGGGTIAVSAERRGGENILRVADTGLGMSQQEKERIFDAFHTTKRSDKGMGLGLFIVKELALKMSWKITVDSSVGTGTTFTIIT